MGQRFIHIEGGGELLPFAESRIKAMRMTGLAHLSQSYDVNGITVKVRISDEDDYITIKGGAYLWLTLLSNRRTLYNQTPGGSGTSSITKADSACSVVYRIPVKNVSSLEMKQAVLVDYSESTASYLQSSTPTSGNLDYSTQDTVRINGTPGFTNYLFYKGAALKKSTYFTTESEGITNSGPEDNYSLHKFTAETVWSTPSLRRPSTVLRNYLHRDWTYVTYDDFTRLVPLNPLNDEDANGGMFAGTVLIEKLVPGVGYQLYHNVFSKPGVRVDERQIEFGPFADPGFDVSKPYTSNQGEFALPSQWAAQAVAIGLDDYGVVILDDIAMIYLAQKSKRNMMVWEVRQLLPDATNTLNFDVAPWYKVLQEINLNDLPGFGTPDPELTGAEFGVVKEFTGRTWGVDTQFSDMIELYPGSPNLYTKVSGLFTRDGAWPKYAKVNFVYKDSP